MPSAKRAVSDILYCEELLYSLESIDTLLETVKLPLFVAPIIPAKFLTLSVPPFKLRIPAVPLLDGYGHKVFESFQAL